MGQAFGETIEKEKTRSKRLGEAKVIQQISGYTPTHESVPL